MANFAQDSSLVFIVIAQYPFSNNFINMISLCFIEIGNLPFWQWVRAVSLETA